MGGTGISAYAALTLLVLLVAAEALVALAVRSEIGRALRSVRDHGAAVEARIRGVLRFAALVAWGAATLAGYGLLQPLTKWIGETLERHIEVGSLDISIGAIVLAIAIVVGTVIFVRITRFVLELDMLPRMKLEPGVDGAISGLTRYILFSAGLLVALAALGIDASQIALVAGALGVGVGFGLQGIVANVIAGIVLMLERPVRLGDFIEVGPLVGKVERIGLRSSTVRALDGAEVIVPNESLISREVVNWTLSDLKRRLEVKVGVAYGTDPKRVLAILHEVATEQRGVLRGPAPEAVFVGFGESSLDFALQFWTEDFADSKRLQSRLGLEVHDALVAAGIEIPFPQRDIHVKTMSAPGLVASPPATRSSPREPVSSPPAPREGPGEGTGR
jgi:small-conductance mechanosensitive channel